MHKQVDLVVQITELKSEHFLVGSGYERQKLVCSGELIYPKRSDLTVEANFQTILPADRSLFYTQSSYTKNTADLYGEEDRLGVVYVREGGIDDYIRADLAFFVDVPNALILKIHQVTSSGLLPSITLRLLVDQKFLVGAYAEPQTPEAATSVEFTDIETTQLVTCAITEVYLRLNHQSPS